MTRVLDSWLLTAGLVGGAVLAACGGGGNGDGGTTTTAAGRAAEPTLTTQAPRVQPPPEWWAGIDREGRLVVVSSGGGEVERVLGEFDHPEECPTAGEPVAGCRWLVDVVVGPDGRHVYYETCCEPAPGTIYRIPIGGGDPEMIAHGAHPAVDPSGRRLALVELQSVTVHPLTPGDAVVRFEAEQPPAALHGMAWSPGGERLAFTAFEDTDGPGRVHVLDLGHASNLDHARPIGPADLTRSWTLPAFRADGMLSLVEQDIRLPERPEGPARRLVVDPVSGEVGATRDLDQSVLSRRYDPTGIHLISVMEDGSVAWASGEGEATMLTEAGYLAAAW